MYVYVCRRSKKEKKQRLTHFKIQPEHVWGGLSGGEVEDWVEHEVDELDVGAGEGQEHHPVHDPESHWGSVGFCVWKRAERSNSNERDKADRRERSKKRDWIRLFKF
jgi:hypothetical protein